MMITFDDMIERFGETELVHLTDFEHCQTIVDKVLQNAIDDALATAESYLAMSIGRNDDTVFFIKNGIPSTPPKALIIRLCDIARYYLYQDGIPDVVQRRYNEAMDWLKTVAKNPAMLTGTTADGKASVAVVANVLGNPYG